MADRPVTIDDVNTLDRDAFVARFGSLFEGSPWIAAEAWSSRPFASRGGLHQALCAVVENAPAEQQIALIQAHPDLVGSAALSGTLGRHSTAEQAAAGLDPDRLSAAEVATFSELNRAYRERFGFPFVICARENKKVGILAGFATRLQHSRGEEIAVALGEIAKICHYRLIEAMPEDD
jgi:2-oxo-4-hydroxy-4-carboxy-5-ureidoimidazoline decarboxylase